jgi:hypothetical protein
MFYVFYESFDKILVYFYILEVLGSLLKVPVIPVSALEACIMIQRMNFIQNKMKNPF